MANLAEAICRGENSDLLATAQSAIQIGHTSGMDAVTGLLIGLINRINQETTVEESRVRRNDPLFINGNRK